MDWFYLLPAGLASQLYGFLHHFLRLDGKIIEIHIVEGVNLCFSDLLTIEQPESWR